MGKYFGTDGFRGEANVTLTADHAFRIGRYIGYLFSKDHTCRVVIGKDTRRSSYMFEYALVAGLTASGAEAYLLHVTTTPSVAYVVRADGFDCGIMISASHNPYYDNGIKLISASGEKMGEDITDEIEAYLDGNRPEPPLAHREKIGATFDYSSGRNRYIGYLISLATRSFKNLSIGLDCANGSAWNIARSVFEALGAKTYTIHNEPNGLNINTNCGSTHIESLSALVKEKNLDVGFAFDGDADRCLAVDNTGRVISGDRILYLCGKYMKERGELAGNTVVTTVMSNIGLYKALEHIGIDTVKTAVGDRFVYEAMQQNGYRLGGEESGHIIFGKYATTGDGILTALKIVEVMLERKETLSRLADEVTIYPQLLKNVRVRDKNQVLASPALAEIIAKEEARLGDSGRILVRASGTEPVVRVMAEAESTELCESVVSNIVAVLSNIESNE
ncbi:MAG: phosphoglucosamine mutase [Clostridia bacterium]|nr:phosphoglucosamine mutase [Clostridia bacterium]